MKRAVCLLLSCVLFLLCCGCAEKPQEQPDGTAFYYPNAQFTFQSDSAVIGTEHRSLAYQDNLTQVLNVYFLGPESDQLLSPFPAGLTVKKTNMEGSTFFITISDHLAELTGLDLTIACSCLTLTILELTDAERVVISAENTLLDGQKSITVDKNNLLLTEVWQEE